MELFLESFLGYAVPPKAYESSRGEISPEYPHFTGFVFKLQANMDPRHRDKVAFVRICSGAALYLALSLGVFPARPLAFNSSFFLSFASSPSPFLSVRPCWRPVFFPCGVVMSTYGAHVL